MAKRRRVVVFGIFDGVHDGHRSLFEQARAYGEELIVIVGRDEICKRLKGKTPRFSEEERVKMVRAESSADKVVLGDPELSTYHVLVRIDPDVVCLGYDQQALEQDLRNWLEREGKSIEIQELKPHKPEVYKNSLIRGGK